MARLLNGWRRLWILIGAVWAVPVLALTWSDRRATLLFWAIPMVALYAVRRRIEHPIVWQVVDRAEVAERPYFIGHEAHRSDHVASLIRRPQISLWCAQIIRRDHGYPRLVGTGTPWTVAARFSRDRRRQRVFLNADASAELVDADQGDDRADDLDVLPVAQPRGELPFVPRTSQATRVVHDCVDNLNRTSR